jgi:hypothetical protein
MKLEGTVYFEILNKYYLNKKGRPFNYGTVYSENLLVLIKSLCDVEVVEKCRRVKGIEDSVRNVIAHQIVMVDEEVIKTRTGGYTCKTIVELIKSLFVLTEIPAKKEYWDSYERLNDKILEKIS